MTQRLDVATRKGLFTARSDTPGVWTIERVGFEGVPITSCLHLCGSPTVFAALNHGHFGAKLHRSDDGGRNWSETACPAYPEKPADVEDLEPMRQKPTPWNTEQIWCLESAGPDRPDSIWCGTIPGGLFRSDDRGETWQLNRPLWDEPKRSAWFGGGYDFPGIHSICVDPRSSDSIRVGISCGGVWQTDDVGTSWKVASEGMIARYMPPEAANDPVTQDPHRVIQCQAAPEVLWSQHHCGVFRSTDGSASWHEIKSLQPSSFGFAVAVHPDDPDVAWFAPAVSDETRIPVDGKVVITRTRDGGKSCDVLRNGLPQQQAYDLVYRHGLDVDSTGNRLAVGSTSGGLWVSEDQGDSFSELSSHLPPINAVRFRNGE